MHGAPSPSGGSLPATVSVPDPMMRIVRFDIPLLDRRLTTVEQPLHDRGFRAGRMVGELLAGGSPSSIVRPVAYREGDTSGPPPAG